MNTGVTFIAKRNQVVGHIVAAMTAEMLMVDLQIRHCAAELASPAIPAQNMVTKLFVQSGVESHGRAFRQAGHDAIASA